MMTILESADQKAGEVLENFLRTFSVETRMVRLQNKLEDLILGRRKSVINLVEKIPLNPAIAVLIILGLGVALNIGASALASVVGFPPGPQPVEPPPVEPMVEANQHPLTIASGAVEQTSGMQTEVVPPLLIPWSLPAGTPEYIMSQCDYISLIVDLNYIHFPIFKEFGFSPSDIKTFWAAVGAFENGGSGRSETGDYGFLQINEMNFLPGEDPTNPIDQGRAAHRVLADGMEHYGTLDGMIMYHNAGRNIPHPDYLPYVRALYELFSTQNLQNYKIVPPGGTLSALYPELQGDYSRVFQYRYNVATQQFEVTPIADPNIIFRGAILVLAN